MVRARELSVHAVSAGSKKVVSTISSVPQRTATAELLRAESGRVEQFCASQGGAWGSFGALVKSAATAPRGHSASAGGRPLQ